MSFADQRVTFDTFRGMKASGELPYGTLPVLVVDGAQKRTIAQSNAILRYAGKLGGLYPTIRSTRYASTSCSTSARK